MANRIYIQVDYQDDNAQKQIDQINQKISAIGTNSTKATAEATKGVQSFSVAIDQAQSHVDSLSQAIVGMGVGQAIREMITLGDQLTRTMAAMQQMGDGASGMAKLRAEADALGLDWAETAQAANRLRNAGLQMKDIVPIIQAIGAYSVVAGGDIQRNFTSAIESVAVVANKRYITVKGLIDQMGTIGVQVMPMIQKAVNAQTGLNESINQVRENMRQVGVMPLLKAITDGSEQAAEAAKKIADNSPVAAFARSKNAAEDLANTLTKVLGPGLVQLAEALKPIIDLLTKALEQFNKLPQPVKDLTVLMLGLAVAIKAVNTALALNAALASASIFGAIATGVRTAAAAIGEFLVGAGEITTILGGTVAIASGWAEVVAVVAAAVAGIAAFYAWTKKIGEEKKNTSAVPDKMGDQGPMLQEDLDAIQKERERAQNALSEAQKRYDAAALQGIAAVAAEYEILYRAVTKVKDAQALATAQQSLEVNVATEVLKHSQEMHKENIKAAEEDAAAARKIAVARASVMPDETFAGRSDLAGFTAAEEQQQIKEQSDAKIAEQKRVTVDQIANIQTLYQAGKISLEAATKDRKDAEIAFTNFYIDQSQLAADKGKEASLKAQREQNALMIEQHKQLQDELLQDNLATIQQEQALTAAYAGAKKTNTVEERLAQIKTIENAQIDSINKTRDAEIAAAQEALAYYKQLHPGGVGVTEEEQKEARDEVRLNQAAQAQIQLDRIAAWKEGNDAVIEQQKQVYESIQEAAGNLFDALTSKTRSVWAAIGDVIKNSLLGALKAVVTSQIAAQLTQALGFGPVTFARTGLGALTPVFSGLGSPPQPSAVSSGLSFDNVVSAIAPQNTANRSADQVIAQARVAGAGGADLPTSEVADTGGSTLDLSSYAALASGGGSTAGFGGFGTGTAGYAALAGGGGSAAGFGGFGTGTVGGAAKISGGGAFSPAMQLNSLKNSLNIGKPIMINGQAVPWSQAPTQARLGAVLNSPGFGTLALTAGSTLALAGLHGHGAGAGTETVLGGALAGVGVAQAFPSLLLTPAAGALLGAGIGLTATGLKVGGVTGLGLDVAGGASIGAFLGTAVFPGLGTVAGAAIGAAAGAIAGAVRMLFPGQLQKAHDAVMQAYGVNITENSILQQIVDLANQKYGGDIRLTVMSTDVQDLVRLYAMSTGQTQANLPRPMYSATFAQSQAGGLQLQPVYSGGQLVANPYTGTTTTQVQNALSQAVYLQLNPQHAQSLFAGQVVQVMGNNPGAVSSANLTAMSSGQNRVATAGAMLEPSTVMG